MVPGRRNQPGDQMTTQDVRLLTVAEVCARIGLSRPALYRRLAKGAFPPPVYVGERSPRWRSDVLAEWIEGLSPEAA